MSKLDICSLGSALPNGKPVYSMTALLQFGTTALDVTALATFLTSTPTTSCSESHDQKRWSSVLARQYGDQRFVLGPHRKQWYPE